MPAALLLFKAKVQGYDRVENIKHSKEKKSPPQWWLLKMQPSPRSWGMFLFMGQSKHSLNTNALCIDHRFIAFWIQCLQLGKKNIHGHCVARRRPYSPRFAHYYIHWDPANPCEIFSTKQTVRASGVSVRAENLGWVLFWFYLCQTLKQTLNLQSLVLYPFLITLSAYQIASFCPRNQFICW